MFNPIFLNCNSSWPIIHLLKYRTVFLHIFSLSRRQSIYISDSAVLSKSDSARYRVKFFFILLFNLSVHKLIRNFCTLFSWLKLIWALDSLFNLFLSRGGQGFEEIMNMTPPWSTSWQLNWHCHESSSKWCHLIHRVLYHMTQRSRSTFLSWPLVAVKGIVSP